jgi:uroporphyrin-III C-methyltransferase/precorrin-2 dehydrogenase/sirohydrochlorin ferrochelatase
VQSSELSFNGRRRFWQLFTERAVTDPGREPQQYDDDRLLAEARAEGARDA